MNPLKTLSFTACALAAATQSSHAQYFNAGLTIYKEYRQTQGTSNAPAFRNGYAFFHLQDGNFAYTGSCGRNGQSTPFPSDNNGCGIGSNGIVVDGVFDSLVPAVPPPPAVPVIPAHFEDAKYYEIVSIQEAVLVGPSRPDLVRLNSIPANSKYPGVFGDVTSVPQRIYYNTQTANGGTLREYKNSYYSYLRTYTSRSQMEQEIVQGQYKVDFPVANPQPTKPNATTLVPFTVLNTVEGYIGGNTPGGFRFINVGPYSGGFAQYDSRITNRVTWAGVDPNLVRSTDTLSISFRSVITPADPNSLAGDTVFPAPGVKILIPNTFQGYYDIPPVFQTGQKIIVEVELVRAGGTAGESVRIFQLPVVFVTTFSASMAIAFPNGTAAIVDKNADPDGDGISNWLEWINGTDPSKANPSTTLSSPSLVQPAATRDNSPTPAYWQMAFDRPLDNLEGDPKPVVETSTNLSTWTKLDLSPESGWSVVDDGGPKIYVRNASPTLTEKRYFRIRYNSN